MEPIIADDAGFMSTSFPEVLPYPAAVPALPRAAAKN
jgi:hypothetical protein